MCVERVHLLSAILESFEVGRAILIKRIPPLLTCIRSSVRLSTSSVRSNPISDTPSFYSFIFLFFFVFVFVFCFFFIFILYIYNNSFIQEPSSSVVKSELTNAAIGKLGNVNRLIYKFEDVGGESFVYLFVLMRFKLRTFCLGMEPLWRTTRLFDRTKVTNVTTPVLTIDFFTFSSMLTSNGSIAMENN